MPGAEQFPRAPPDPRDRTLTVHLKYFVPFSFFFLFFLPMVFVSDPMVTFFCSIAAGGAIMESSVRIVLGDWQQNPAHCMEQATNRQKQNDSGNVLT